MTVGLWPGRFLVFPCLPILIAPIFFMPLCPVALVACVVFCSGLGELAEAVVHSRTDLTLIAPAAFTSDLISQFDRTFVWVLSGGIDGRE